MTALVNQAANIKVSHLWKGLEFVIFPTKDPPKRILQSSLRYLFDLRKSGAYILSLIAGHEVANITCGHIRK